jgi:sugar lactone lactonase YvrE
MKKTKLLLALCLAGYMANAQNIYTMAGNGTGGYSGDGGQATSAEINNQYGITLDGSGNLYIADQVNNRIRKITTAGIISTIAGNGTLGYSGDGGQATVAELNLPTSLAFDASGNLYIGDLGNYCVRKITTAGIISTFAGTGTGGYSGDGGQATAAKLNQPSGIACDAFGNIYIADDFNYRVRKVTTSGIITTIAGNGTTGFSGDGGQATAAELGLPGEVAFDASGNLYIVDSGNNRIRKVTTTGIISTIVGNGTGGFSGDGGSATAAELHTPYGLTVDAGGNLYIADGQNNRIRKVTTTGIISTIVGNGTGGFSGDGAAATAAELSLPVDVAINITGNLYISDIGNSRIRNVTPLCLANAGPNVNDYDNGDGAVCAAVSIGTPSVSTLSYAWSPTVALSCTNCAQPNTSYDVPGTPKVYTLTVSGTGCTTNTSTVQVTTLTPTITANITNITAVPGSSITVVVNYTANYTPDYYYMSIKQYTSTGGTVTPSYSWDNGWGPVLASGSTFTFPNTSTLTCNTYYEIWTAIGSSAVCGNGVWATGSGTVFQIAPPANAGPNQTNTQDGCGHWTPGVTLGTPAVSGMTYTWNTGTNLSPTNTATTTSTYSTTASSQTITYTLTVGHSGCTSSTSTVQVTAVKSGCAPGCCRMSGIATEAETTENFVVYPNPANGQVTLFLYDKADYIQIIDMQGRLVFETKHVVAQEFKLDISKYTSGIYFIRAKIGDVIEKQKLIVE